MTREMTQVDESQVKNLMASQFWLRSQRMNTDYFAQDCEVGTVPLEALEAHCRIDGLEESFEAFVKLLGRADLGPTRSDLEKLMQDGRHGWHTFEEWKDLYNEAFHSFDQNGDGLLCKAEMQDAFFNWYGVRGKITDLIFHLVDREPETDALSKEDVYLAMFALVGVRGSISSKTVNKNVSRHRLKAGMHMGAQVTPFGQALRWHSDATLVGFRWRSGCFVMWLSDEMQ
eukprot:s2450_g12.t1